MSARFPSAARPSLVVFLLGAALVAPPTLASAQTTSADALAAARLEQTLRPGDTLTITLPDDTRVKGRFIQVSPERLAVATDEGRREVPVRDVQRVRRTRMGVLLGTIIGAGVGAGLGAAAASYVENETGEGTTTFLTIFGIGLATGCGIDAMVNIPRTIYVRDAPRVSVAPVVTPRGTGVGVRLRF